MKNVITLTNRQVDAMLAAQDVAASRFWAYPDDNWQMNFQADYLMLNYGTPTAKDPSDLYYGDK